VLGTLVSSAATASLGLGVGLGSGRWPRPSSRGHGQVPAGSALDPDVVHRPFGEAFIGGLRLALLVAGAATAAAVLVVVVFLRDPPPAVTRSAGRRRTRGFGRLHGLARGTGR